jgi:hypothetical protein
MNLPFFKNEKEYRAFEKVLAPERGLKGTIVKCSACGGIHALTGEQERKYKASLAPKRFVNRPVKVDMAEARRIGIARQGQHEQGTQRFFDDKNEEDIIGAACEMAFEELTGLKMDLALRPKGDGGIDFRVVFKGVERTLDVKGFRIPKHLPVKEHEISRCADILVLAKFDNGIVTFLGWSTRKVLEQQPIVDFGYGIRNYALEAWKCRKMEELFAGMKQ